MAQLRENSGRARTAIIIMSFFFGISIITFFAEYSQYELLGRIENGNFTMDEATQSDMIVGVIGITSAILNLLAAVFFIMWFRRAYYNLAQIPNSNVSYTDGWAAGAWFVPLLNWFRPFEIMKEIWYDTQKYSGVSEEEVEQGSMLGFWWACWLIGSILGNISTRMTFGDPTIGELRTSILLSMVSTVVLIPAFILIIKIIKRVAVFEKTMYDNKNELDIEAHLISTPVN